MRLATRVAALLVTILVAGVLPRTPTSVAAATAAAADPSLGALVGQKLMVAMSGTMPDAGLLGRVERGEVGGVILFGSNIVSAAQVRALTTALRHAAATGGQPPPLIATDQEGGSVRRVPWAPPTLSPPQLGARGSASTARQQGAATGVALACAGIDTDLAPVADVPASSSSFLERQGRTWSSSASVTATLADAFTSGLEDGHVDPAMKHFPGLGFATRNTDDTAVTHHRVEGGARSRAFRRTSARSATACRSSCSRTRPTRPTTGRVPPGGRTRSARTCCEARSASPA